MKNLIKLGYKLEVSVGTIRLLDYDDNKEVALYDLVSKDLTSNKLDLYTLEVFIKVINKYESGK